MQGNLTSNGGFTLFLWLLGWLSAFLHGEFESGSDREAVDVGAVVVIVVEVIDMERALSKRWKTNGLIKKCGDR